MQTLEKEGVGRPSTYATIIGTIQDRGYVIKVSNQLVPTFTAFAVNRLLETHFPSLVDTQFTARMEQTLDDIADGEVESLPYLREFYLGEKGLETQVSEKTASIDPREIYALALPELDARVRIGRYGPYIEQMQSNTEGGERLRTSLPPDLAPADLTDEDALRLLREKEKGPDTLGSDPETGKPIFLLSGRFGPYVQLGEADDNGGKPKRASLLKDMKPDSVTLDIALDLLRLPRFLGNHPETGEAVEAGVARLGPFVRHGKDYRSLTAEDHVLTVMLPRALELLSQPKARRGMRAAPQPLRELGAHPDGGGAVVVLNGRYGPYVKHGAVNATLPKGITPESVTLAQALDLIAERAAKAPVKKTRGRKPAASKSATSTTAKSKVASKAAAPKAAKPKTTAKVASKTGTATKTVTRKKAVPAKAASDAVTPAATKKPAVRKRTVPKADADPVADAAVEFRRKAETDAPHSLIPHPTDGKNAVRSCRLFFACRGGRWLVRKRTPHRARMDNNPRGVGLRRLIPIIAGNQREFFVAVVAQNVEILR